MEPRKYVRSSRTIIWLCRGPSLRLDPATSKTVLKFAAKAWRRPLSEAEKTDFGRFYTKSTETDKIDHGKAIETLIARILVSPAFLYRVEQPRKTRAMKPLSDWEIASRLSYFLWSSIPDDELRRAAAAGN